MLGTHKNFKHLPTITGLFVVALGLIMAVTWLMTTQDDSATDLNTNANSRTSSLPFSRRKCEKEAIGLNPEKVTALLGQPKNIRTNPNGEDTWYYVAGSILSDAAYELCILTFKDNTVRHGQWDAALGFER